jgi:hypothetical protein
LSNNATTGLKLQLEIIQHIIQDLLSHYDSEDVRRMWRLIRQGNSSEAEENPPEQITQPPQENPPTKESNEVTERQNKNDGEEVGALFGIGGEFN